HDGRARRGEAVPAPRDRQAHRSQIRPRSHVRERPLSGAIGPHLDASPGGARAGEAAVKPLDQQLAETVAELRGAKRIALVSHRDPDPDTIGAVIALGGALEGLGKTVTYHCADPVPEGYHFLSGPERFTDAP